MSVISRGGPLAGQGPFANLRHAGVGHGAYAWLSSFWLGYQDIYREEQPRLRLVLHSGNVAGPVPLPRAILLFAQRDHHVCWSRIDNHETANIQTQ